MNLAKSRDTKSIHRNHLHFYILTMKNQKEQLRDSIPFTITTKRIKYLGINLSKETKELYTENYKTLMKEIKDNKNIKHLNVIIYLQWTSHCENVLKNKEWHPAKVTIKVFPHSSICLFSCSTARPPHQQESHIHLRSFYLLLFPLLESAKLWCIMVILLIEQKATEWNTQATKPLAPCKTTREQDLFFPMF